MTPVETRIEQATSQPVNTGEVTPRNLQETFRAQVQKTREQYPTLATRIDNAALPGNVGDITLGLAARWAEKSPVDILKKADQLNQQATHPALREVVETHGLLDTKTGTNDPLALKRDTTERLVRLHVQQELLAMNGTGPTDSEKPGVIKKAGELAKDIVDHVGGRATTMTRGVAYDLINGNYRNK